MRWGTLKNLKCRTSKAYALLHSSRRARAPTNEIVFYANIRTRVERTGEEVRNELPSRDPAAPLFATIRQRNWRLPETLTVRFIGGRVTREQTEYGRSRTRVTFLYPCRGGNGGRTCPKLCFFFFFSLTGRLSDLPVATYRTL